MGFQLVVKRVLRWLAVVKLLFFLMRTRNHIKLFVGIKHLVGEACDVRVHASLAVKYANKARATLAPLPVYQPFEERLATIGYADGI